MVKDSLQNRCSLTYLSQVLVARKATRMRAKLLCKEINPSGGILVQDKERREVDGAASVG